MKKLNYLITGLGIGFIFTTFFMLLFIGFNEITTQVLGWFIASGIYGLIGMIYENQKISLAVQNIIHFSVCLSTTLVMVMMFYKEYTATVIVSFVITYIIIFTAMWQIEKRKIQEMNEKLAKR